MEIQEGKDRRWTRKFRVITFTHIHVLCKAICGRKHFVKHLDFWTDLSSRKSFAKIRIHFYGLGVITLYSQASLTLHYIIIYPTSGKILGM